MSLTISLCCRYATPSKGFAKARGSARRRSYSKPVAMTKRDVSFERGEGFSFFLKRDSLFLPIDAGDKKTSAKHHSGGGQRNKETHEGGQTFPLASRDADQRRTRHTNAPAATDGGRPISQERRRVARKQVQGTQRDNKRESAAYQLDLCPAERKEPVWSR